MPMLYVSYWDNLQKDLHTSEKSLIFATFLSENIVHLRYFPWFVLLNDTLFLSVEWLRSSDLKWHLLSLYMNGKRRKLPMFNEHVIGGAIPFQIRYKGQKRERILWIALQKNYFVCISYFEWFLDTLFIFCLIYDLQFTAQNVWNDITIMIQSTFFNNRHFVNICNLPKYKF